MSSGYEHLVNKVKQEASKKSKYNQCANDLISNGFGMSLDEILGYDTLDSMYLMGLKYFFVFLKYLAEAPKGINYTTLSDHYIFAVQQMPKDCQSEVITSLTENYVGGLCKEIKTEVIEELIEWIKVYAALKANNIDIQAFEDKLYIKISGVNWNTVEDNNSLNIQKCQANVELFKVAQKKKFDLGNGVTLFISFIYTYLYTEYKMYEGGQRNDLKDISMLVGGLKKLKIEKESSIQQVKELAEFFGSLSSNHRRRSRKEKDEFDLNKAKLVEEIHSNNTRKEFSVKVYLYNHQNYGNIAVKVYDRKSMEYDMNRINKEIEILETLSEKSTPENCFIKLYGKGLLPDQVWFAMEYHPSTLMAEITKMKNKNEKFPEIKLIWFAKELVTAFATMEELKIYHQDIKPHNILVTSEGRLKIVDFGISESKCDNESTYCPTGVYLIQGTRGYMAPELEYAVINNIKEKVKFRRGKADVFSLGITLLQLYCLEELHALNYPENNQKLLKKVADIKYVWLSTLLKYMLQLNYKDRGSFKECMKHIPTADTEGTTFYRNK